MAAAASDKVFNPRVVWDAEVQKYLESSLGNFVAIAQTTCTPPTTTCFRTNTWPLGLTTEEVACKFKAELWSLVNCGNRASVHPSVPCAIMLPGSGPHTVHYSTAGGREVIISRPTAEAVLRGAHIYAPGLLACSAGVQPGDLVAISYDTEAPGSTSSRICRGSVVRADGTCTGSADRSGCYVGLGRAVMSKTQMFNATSGVAVEVVQPVWQLPSLADLEQLAGSGRGMLQNLPSIIAAMALSPPPGSRVLDMCAAPGGKSTMLAQLMHDSGCIIALDRTESKAAHIAEMASRQCLTCITAYKMDATKAVLRSCAADKTMGAPLRSVALHTPGSAAVAGGGHVPAGLTGPASGVRVADLTHAPQPSQQQCLSGGSLSSDMSSGAPTWDGGKHDELTMGAAERDNPCSVVAETNLPSLSVNSNDIAQAQQPSVKEQMKIQRKAAARAARGLPPIVTSERHAAHGQHCMGFPPQSFDYILLDAPCSGLGLRPRLVQPVTMQVLHQCAAYQRKLLVVAVQLLRPGGCLVYSTCSIATCENEANVRYVLDTFSDILALEASQPCLGQPGLTGQLLADPLSNRPDAEDWLSADEAPLVQRFDVTGDSIGFFIARFRRRAA